MFYISEIYDYSNSQVRENSYSDISLVAVRNTQTDFYREFKNAYAVRELNAKIAGCELLYLHAFNQYEVNLLQMIQYVGVDTDYPKSAFQKLPNTLKCGHLEDYGTFSLFKDTMSAMHYTVLDLIPTQACCINVYENGSAFVYIYCYFGDDLIQYFIKDYNQFILAFTKYNVLMKGRR